MDYAINYSVIELHAHIDYGDQILRLQPSQLSSGQREARLKQLEAKHRMMVSPRYFVSIDFDFSIEESTISWDLMDNLPGIAKVQAGEALEKLFKNAC